MGYIAAKVASPPMKSLIPLLLSISAFLIVPKPPESQSRTMGLSQEAKRSMGREKEPNSLLPESQQGLWLVKARCIAVTLSERKTADWKIEHIFNGPESINSRPFTIKLEDVSHPDSWRASYWARGASYFVPNVNEEALWIVQLYLDKEPKGFGSKEKDVIRAEYVDATSDNLGSSSNGGLPYRLKLPIGKNHPLVGEEKVRGLSTYAQALEHAQAVERFAKTSKAEQIRVLENYMHSPSHQLRAWAIRTYTAKDEEDTFNILEELASSPRCSPEELLCLAPALERRANKGSWRANPLRLTFWQRLATSRLDKTDAEEAARLICGIESDQGFPTGGFGQARNQEFSTSASGQWLFDLLRMAANNSKWPQTARGEALSSVSILNTQGLLARSTAWDYLLQRLIAHPDYSSPLMTPPSNENSTLRTNLAMNALEGLSILRPFSQQEENALQRLEVGAKSSELKDLFEEVLRPKPISSIWR